MNIMRHMIKYLEITCLSRFKEDCHYDGHRSRKIFHFGDCCTMHVPVILYICQFDFLREHYTGIGMVHTLLDF